MTWMVDLELLVDILEDDPEHGAASAALIDSYRAYGELYISPIAYVQMGPLFSGLREIEDRFLANIGVVVANRNTEDTLGIIHTAWCQYVKDTHDNVSEIPFTKLLIGAQALSYDGLLTRRPETFKRFFPKLSCYTEAPKEGSAMPTSTPKEDPFGL